MDLKTIELKEYPAIKNLIQCAFPEYRKKKATLSYFSGRVNINSYWSEGSKDEYAIVHIPSLQKKTLPTSTHPYFDIASRGMANHSTPDVEADSVGNLYLKRLPEGYVLIQSGVFCGKPATVHVYIGQNDQNLLEGGK